MPVSVLLTLITMLGAQLTSAVRSRRTPGEAGATTLEMTIIALGLITVATMLIVALTNAVRSRTEQIQ